MSESSPVGVARKIAIGLISAVATFIVGTILAAASGGFGTLQIGVLTALAAVVGLAAMTLQRRRPR